MWQSCLWNRVSKWKVLFWLLRTLVIFELFCYNMSIYKLYCCLLLLYTSEFAIFHGPSQAHFIPFCSWFDSSSINFWNVLGRSFCSLANVIGKCYFFSAEIRVLEISTHRCENQLSLLFTKIRSVFLMIPQRIIESYSESLWAVYVQRSDSAFQQQPYLLPLEGDLWLLAPLENV